MSQIPSCGVVYVATTDKLLEEAEISAASLRKHNPGLPVMLMTHARPPGILKWDEVFILEAPHFSSRDKLNMVSSPWEKTLFLDTDTVVFCALDPVFQLLDRFDFAAVQPSSGYHYSIDGLPDSFPEFNSGVIAFKRSAATNAFFESWQKFYELHAGQQGRVWDQKSLRHALYLSDLRLAALPQEYNFMIYEPGVATTGIKIAHGRPAEKLFQMRQVMDQKPGTRAWIPGIGCLYKTYHLPFGHLVRLYIRTFPSWLYWFLVRVAGRFKRTGKTS